MTRQPDSVRARAIRWIVWPVFVVVVGVSVLHFLNYRLERGPYWTGSVWQLLVLALLVLGPQAAAERWARRGRGRAGEAGGEP